MVATASKHIPEEKTPGSCFWPTWPTSVTSLRQKLSFSWESACLEGGGSLCSETWTGAAVAPAQLMPALCPFKFFINPALPPLFLVVCGDQCVPLLEEDLFQIFPRPLFLLSLGECLSGSGHLGLQAQQYFRGPLGDKLVTQGPG